VGVVLFHSHGSFINHKCTIHLVNVLFTFVQWTYSCTGVMLYWDYWNTCTHAGIFLELLSMKLIVLASGAMIFDLITRYFYQKRCSYWNKVTLWYSFCDLQDLGILKQKFPNTPVLALTATATASVKEDVVQALGLANCIVFRQSFNRPNLR
jgi:hypothetical protein